MRIRGDEKVKYVAFSRKRGISEKTVLMTIVVID
jgi:hypothetical protein